MLSLSLAPPAKPSGIFPPITQDASPPAPKPAPGSVPVLSADVMYVVPSDEAFLLFASPAGLVTVTRETGPIKIRGKFLDGTGKVETRTYAAKNIAIVESAGKGRVELIAVPVGAADENVASRMLIEANNGAQPPPDDKKDPAPDPKPKPPPIDPDPKPQPDLVDGPVWLVTVTGPDRSIAAARVVNDTAFWKGLEAAGHKFRHYSPTDASAVTGGYTKVHEAIGDCLVITKMSGDVVRKVKMPTTTDTIERLLKETVK